jgi:hypothetical protein
MNVSYVEPLRLSVARMTRMLFKPARAGFWFTLGFAAFLSEYLSWGMGRSGGRARGDRVPDELAGDVLGRIVDFLRNPVVTGVVIAIALCALVAYVLVTWISSRGRFVFLDNVARERAAIREPWSRHRKVGNSLFVWRLVFNTLVLMIVGAIIAPFLAAIAALVHSDSFRVTDLFVLLPLPFMLLPVGLVAGFVTLYRMSFVEPLMYRHDVGVLEAWGRFLALFVRRPWPFLLFALFALALLAVAIAIVFAFGIGTLAIGFILLAIPYVGSVLLLPLEVVFRAVGPEFLAQFGEEYAALGAPAAPVTPPAAAPTSAPMGQTPPAAG